MAIIDAGAHVVESELAWDFMPSEEQATGPQCCSPKRVTKRLRWTVTVPTLEMGIAIEELHYDKEHGGRGLFMRCIEGEHRLTGPYCSRNGRRRRSWKYPSASMRRWATSGTPDYFGRDCGLLDVQAARSQRIPRQHHENMR